jgi:hypothetical protein
MGKITKKTLIPVMLHLTPIEIAVIQTGLEHLRENNQDDSKVYLAAGRALAKLHRVIK